MVLLRDMDITTVIITNLLKQGSVLEKMSIDFNTILESNYIPYDSAGVVRQKLVGYGTTLLYSSANKHYAFARYYTKDGKKGAWATTEFKKDDYITGSLIFS